jgi:hypothetical protein
MTHSWQGRGGARVIPEVPAELRDRLAAVADELIPAADGMPAAAAVGVAGDQLDAVLRARPDLAGPLERALRRAPGPPIEAWMDELCAADPAAHEALVLAVLAGYYWAEEVKSRLGYPGQTAAEVSVGFPAYVEEGLLDAVLEQGPRYRDPEV